jgi:hypothetical protein
MVVIIRTVICSLLQNLDEELVTTSLLQKIIDNLVICYGTSVDILLSNSSNEFPEL